MNYHLFLDLLAGAWGIILSALLACALYDYVRHKSQGAMLAAIPLSFLATICWAWIIAG